MIRFELDGRRVEADVAPTTTLLQWLRASGARGTKEGCAEGDCGACTVAVLDPDATRGPAWRAVNSCLVLLPMVDGRKVVTVAGLHRDEPHPAQDALVRALGSQCGYCTPGFAMSLFEACHRPELARAREDDWRLDDQVCGNLCRCTGYRPIRDALRAVAGSCPADGWGSALAPATAAVAHESAGQVFHAPATVAEVVALLARHPAARLVCGATDLGLDVTQRHVAFPVLVSVERVAALRGVRRAGGRIVVGAATPLVDLEDWSADGLPVLHRMLRYFGSRQIKHRATIGGNLCNASPIGDLAPVLLALGADLVAAGPGGERSVPIDQFFTGYRATALAPGELLVRVEIPEPAAGTRLGAYKVSRRRELDISAVAAGMAVGLDREGRVARARLGFGGVAATPKRATATEAALLGRPWTLETVQAAAARLDEDFAPIDDLRGSAVFRRALARNLLVGFHEETKDVPFVPLPPRHAATVILPEGA